MCLENESKRMIISEFSEYIPWSQRTKSNLNIICTNDECGETFYGCHTAQHPAAVTTNNNEMFRSFKSKENIHKKEVVPYRGFSY